MPGRVGGIIEVAIGGIVHNAKGAFDCNLGRPKREAVVGSDGVHGYKEEVQPGFVEGALTDDGTLDINALVTASNVTVTVSMANGKVFSLYGAWYAGEGTINTEEGEIAVRYESGRAEEV